ncbi:hypothetical protein RRG08_008611 [Elysia crispata]|uniref:Uncharacterized protein n=1 Tax=Elysia crispata TaxID=231223 RepID=A0AAE1B781_9GAST|nr:hypothetical protein RRG08_008611 [Elysia crispata]
MVELYEYFHYLVASAHPQCHLKAPPPSHPSPWEESYKETPRSQQQSSRDSPHNKPDGLGARPSGQELTFKKHRLLFLLGTLTRIEVDGIDSRVSISRYSEGST